MKVKRLSGPKTHICWTPDAIPERKRELVSLAREADLLALEALAEDLRVDLLAEIDRAEKAETERDELKEALGTMAAELIVRGKIIDELEAELARHHLTNGCPNTYHNEGCADSHRTVCEYR